MALNPEHSADKSWALYDRALEYIPMGTQTHSKAPREALRGVEPCFIERGEGCRIWDVDGNEYIDFRNGLGPIILGYRFPAVDEAVRWQLEKGTVFSYAHPLEVEVAQRLVEMVPSAERVRFLKTGGEAMAASHRLARAFTGRDLIVSCGYHGWINSMGRSGVPQAMRDLYCDIPWGDGDACRALLQERGREVAAISVACGYADIEKGGDFLPLLRQLSQECGALLIFDEIVTGFRLAPGGAQEYFDVVPDLTVLAKGISNGVPLSCYAGRRDIMETVQEVVISSTYGGDTLGLAAARAVLDTYASEDVIGYLWARGRQLHQGLAAIAAELAVPVGFAGLPPLGQLQFSHADSSRNGALMMRFEGELLQRGVVVFSVCYTNFSHGQDDIDEALAAMREGLVVMQAEGLFDA
ncbi:MAG: aminotransferase class III-fold pyridoxal phosphate-dependent enzyme [Candidatus Latescibacteria bacterium]|nr:aminotransferase class III-fold pyridoxal phosphate-dependent enzyme [Candidatus Latescibacterota bacterium]